MVAQLCCPDPESLIANLGSAVPQNKTQTHSFQFCQLEPKLWNIQSLNNTVKNQPFILHQISLIFFFFFLRWVFPVQHYQNNTGFSCGPKCCGCQHDLGLQCHRPNIRIVPELLIKLIQGIYGNQTSLGSGPSSLKYSCECQHNGIGRMHVRSWKLVSTVSRTPSPGYQKKPLY